MFVAVLFVLTGGCGGSIGIFDDDDADSVCWFDSGLLINTFDLFAAGTVALAVSFLSAEVAPAAFLARCSSFFIKNKIIFWGFWV